MNSDSKEHLSSLMDGEITRDAGRFLLRRLAADDSLRATWARYHMIRDSLRHPNGGFAKLDLTQRVSLALSSEPSPDTGAFPWLHGWLRPVAGVAIAASVALIAVVTVASRPGDTGPAVVEARAVETAAAEPFTSPNLGSLIPVSQPVNLSGAINQDNRRMNAYLLRHYQAAGETGRGFVSFVPIVVTRTPAESEDSELPEDTPDSP